MTSPLTRLLVIGLDGATFDLVDPWAAAGRLPNLRRLMERGCRATLRSTLPPMTFPAWSTFMTGLNPGKHGIFDFTVRMRGSYGVRFINSTFREGRTLWRILSDAGCRVGVMGIPTTYPPERVNGFMISGFDAPVATGIDPSFVHPRELFHEIRNNVGAYKITDFQEIRIGKGWHDAVFPKILEVLERKLSIAKYLLRKGDYDCFAVLFGESDTVAHHYWMFHDPRSPRYDPEGAKRHGKAILRVYERLDKAVGELVEMLPDGTPAVVLSDHGFGGTGVRALYLNRWLAKEGYLRFRPLRLRTRALQGAKRIGLRLTPPRLQERLFRSLGGRLADRVESASRAAGIDWKGTRAFSDELNYFPSIWIHRKERFPQGTVTEGEAEALRSEIIGKLESLTNPVTGERMVRKAWRREDLYEGPFVERAPDIVIDLHLDRGYAYPCLSSAGRPGAFLRTLKKSAYRGGKGIGMNGSHRREGILILSGRGVKKGERIPEADIEDLTPTILRILGVPSSEEMDGRVLREAFDVRKER